MAYFPNGESARDYEERYCNRCVHQKGGCAVWQLHMLRNYDDCNDPKSPLHVLIPRSKDRLDNEQCRMFYEIPRSR